MATMDFASLAGEAASTAASAGLGLLSETSVVGVDFLPQETSKTAETNNRQVVLFFMLISVFRTCVERMVEAA
jgi:hypothetical protein